MLGELGLGGCCTAPARITGKLGRKGKKTVVVVNASYPIFQAPLGFQQRWQDAGSNNGWTPSLRSWIVQLVVAPVASCFNLVESPHFSCLLPGVKSLPPKGVSLVCGGAHLQVAGVYGGPPVVGRHAHGTPPGGVGHRVRLGDTSCLGVSRVETASNNECHTIGRTG